MDTEASRAKAMATSDPDELGGEIFELCDALDAAETRVAALEADRERKAQYVGHLSGCGYVVKHSTSCDCGLMTALHVSPA